MSEATGRTAVTIHRLLEFNPQLGGFTRDADKPIEADVVVLDESSMIDLSLADHLVDAVPFMSRLIFVGDMDQLPSVGPGAVLRDIIASISRWRTRCHVTRAKGVSSRQSSLSC
jgi:exodeoxyribonuclease V alpha subunit